MSQHDVPDISIWAAVLDSLTEDDRITPQLYGFLSLAVPQGVMAGTLYLDVPNDLTAAQFNKAEPIKGKGVDRDGHPTSADHPWNRPYRT